MISNLVLQDTINGIRNISKCELILVDLEGKVVASTVDEAIVSKADIVSFVESQAEFQEIRGSMYLKVYDDYNIEFVVIVSGGEDAAMVGKLAAFQLHNLLVAYKEHFDKDNFIKNLLLTSAASSIFLSRTSPATTVRLRRSRPCLRNRKMISSPRWMRTASS